MLFKSHMLEKMDEFKLDALVLATAAGKDALLAPRVVDKRQSSQANSDYMLSAAWRF